MMKKIFSASIDINMFRKGDTFTQKQHSVKNIYLVMMMKMMVVALKTRRRRNNATGSSY